MKVTTEPQAVQKPQTRSFLNGKAGEPFIQPKLTVNEPGDAYEQEADAMAERVMRMSDPTLFMSSAPIHTLQRKCAHCEEEKKLQRKETGDTSAAAPNSVQQTLRQSGQPLSAESRSFFEPRFGQDFSGVRIHTDGGAANSARQINALAYTSGQNVVFGSGQYQPESAGGKRLLAHELTHVVQQKQSDLPAVQRREISSGILTARLGPQDWYFSDRLAWQDASANGTERALSPTNTFMRSAFYNTQNLRPTEYQNVEQRHDYYDLISYVIEFDRNTPAAIRDVRFFHATTAVTGSPGIGTVDSPAGAIALRQDTRVILREVNTDLFATNMRVINDLLVGRQTPQNPNNPTQQLSAFDFDLQMVEYEQSQVERYIQTNRTRFTPEVNQDINDTMDPTGFGQWANPSQRGFQWALQALGVSRLDFTVRAHRVAIGRAEVFIFHRKTLQDYLVYMRPPAPAPVTCLTCHPQLRVMPPVPPQATPSRTCASCHPQQRVSPSQQLLPMFGAPSQGPSVKLLREFLDVK